MARNNDITKVVRAIEQNLHLRGNKRQNEIAVRFYDLIREYHKTQDLSMPYVFAEFKRGLGRRINETSIPHKTPDEMRYYLAVAHIAIEFFGS
jgi:hypothetical protein